MSDVTTSLYITRELFILCEKKNILQETLQIGNASKRVFFSQRNYVFFNALFDIDQSL